jgi:carboxypeptidase Taq
MSEVVRGTATAELGAALHEIVRIQQALRVLNWDQLVYMPPGGAVGRAEQIAVLEGIAHEKLTDPRIGALIARAQDKIAGLDPDGDEARLVRVASRDYQQAIKLPRDLVMAYARTSGKAEPVWREARARNDFAAFAPWLQKLIELQRQVAEHLGYSDQPFDALVDQAEPGMTTASVRAIFAELRPRLADLVRRITPQVQSVDDTVLHRAYDEIAQERLGRDVAQRFGYSFTRGRLDRTTHPFETSLGRDDVRITTRYDTRFLSMALMGTMHETGHALYEQGIAPELDATILGHGVSAGFHESQSRLWENYVGRSLPFWRWYYPMLQGAFPGVLDDVSLERFYRAINKVQPSLIRVEADEVTYCLHIMLRFELEIALFDGTLTVKDAPEAWNAAMQEYVRVRPPNDTEGILQDIHWSSGFGGFQGYALGNIIAAQLWETVLATHPNLLEEIGRGEFATLREWLRVHVHQHGRKYDPAELVQRVTGRPLSSDPYLAYLTTKFGAIYAL